MNVLRSLVLAVSIGLIATAARADDWAGPQVREIFSASRDHFVRITPGDNLAAVVGFGGSAKGKNATAEYYRRHPDRSYRLEHTATLLNPVAPVDAFVSNDARLVTVDNWHNRGYGDVLAVYGADGKLVKSYALEDLFPKAEIDAFPHSVSSRHWHKGPVYLNKDQRTLHDGDRRSRHHARGGNRPLRLLRNPPVEVRLPDQRCRPLGAVPGGSARSLTNAAPIAPTML